MYLRNMCLLVIEYKVLISSNGLLLNFESHLHAGRVQSVAVVCWHQISTAKRDMNKEVVGQTEKQGEIHEREKLKTQKSKET